MNKDIAMDDMAGRILLEISVAFTIVMFIGKDIFSFVFSYVDCTMLLYQGEEWTPHYFTWASHSVDRNNEMICHDV